MGFSKHSLTIHLQENKAKKWENAQFLSISLILKAQFWDRYVPGKKIKFPTLLYNTSIMQSHDRIIKI